MPRKVSVLHRVWALSILVILALIAINAFQSYGAIKELVDNERRAATTKAILRTLTDVFSSVQDAELGLRGFLISGKADHLRPYFTALENVQQHISTLRSYESELPEQKQKTNHLEQAILARLEAMTDQINQKSDREDLDWVSTINMIESHESLTDIRNLVSSMKAAEYRLLEAQSQEARLSHNKVMRTIVVANGVSLLMVLVIAILLYRAINHHQMEAYHLEALVEQRTRELNRYAEELRRSNRELQDFAFVASHDLQEPLRKIRAFGDRLKDRYATQLGDGSDYVERMQRAAVRMSALIEDLLAFSRVSTRARPFAPVALNDLLDETLENLSVRIEETGARIEREPLPQVEADASQIKQLLQNLLSNALKFMAPGVTPEIRISCRPQDSGYAIDIADNGIGFDEQYLEKIFTPFQRLHGKEQYEGTGIGLAICRRIVERHGGTLTARSQPDVGTTFTITLPEKPPPEVAPIDEVDYD
ncbi:MAG: histidine kinase [Pseudomonadales bacterium]|nr:histidine kinase [Pseudomonadales bacterium]